MSTFNLTLKHGEKKVVRFKYNIPISDATFTFGLKRSKTDASFAIKIEDGAFDKTEVADKIVKCTVNTIPLLVGKTYCGEVEAVFSVDHIDKSPDILIHIIQGII